MINGNFIRALFPRCNAAPEEPFEHSGTAVRVIGI
jgi:hypothetical protein